jgi:hypothetical protein
MPVPTNYRWLFEDPILASSYRVPFNPNKMSDPFPQKALEALANVHGVHRTLRRGTMTPKEWTFSGVIREQDHYDQLLFWSQKANPINITDHYGRIFNVVPVRFNPTEKRPSATVPDKYNYDFTVLVLGVTLP